MSHNLTTCQECFKESINALVVETKLSLPIAIVTSKLTYKMEFRSVKCIKKDYGVFSQSELPHKQLNDFNNPPSTSFYKNYLTSERKISLKNVLVIKLNFLKENEGKIKDIWHEFDTNRSMLFDKSCNIVQLYKQNRLKLLRNNVKYENEVKTFHNSLKNFELILLNYNLLKVINHTMGEFLSKLLLYVEFFNKKALINPFELINYYNSILYCYKFLNLQYEHLNNLITITKFKLIKSLHYYAKTCQQLYKLIRTNKISINNHELLAYSYNMAVDLMKYCGFKKSLSLFNIKDYKMHLLKEIIKFNNLDANILNRSFSYQLNVIRKHIQLLKLILHVD